MFTGTRTNVVGIIGVLFFAVLVTTGGATRAAIIGTYVDADPTGGSPNTTPASAFPSGFTYSGSYSDNKWDVRTDLGINSTVIEAGGNSENPPLITTTVTGLVPDLYDVYVLFGSTTTASWSVRAALSGGSLVEYDKDSVGVIDTGLLPDSLVIHLYEMKIGTVSGVSSFAVDVRNSTHSGLVATFYEGVAYAPVPEPCTVTLVGCCVLVFARRRFGR